MDDAIPESIHGWQSVRCMDKTRYPWMMPCPSPSSMDGKLQRVFCFDNSSSLLGWAIRYEFPHEVVELRISKQAVHLYIHRHHQAWCALCRNPQAAASPCPGTLALPSSSSSRSPIRLVHLLGAAAHAPDQGDSLEIASKQAATESSRESSIVARGCVPWCRAWGTPP